LKRWIRALRVQPPAHNPGFIRLRAQCALAVCPGCGLAALPVRCMHRTLAGQPVQRMRRTHARPSVPGPDASWPRSTLQDLRVVDQVILHEGRDEVVTVVVTFVPSQLQRIAHLLPSLLEQVRMQLEL